MADHNSLRGAGEYPHWRIDNAMKALYGDNATFDTGWVAITPESGYTAGDGFGYRRIGNVVYLRGKVSGSYSTSYVDVTTLPEGVRPAVYSRFSGGAWATSSPVTFVINVTTAGVVSVGINGSGSAGDCHFAGISWLVD